MNTTLRFSLPFIAGLLAVAYATCLTAQKGECPLLKWPPDISGFFQSDFAYMSASRDDAQINDDFNVQFELDIAQTLEWDGWTGSARADIDVRGTGSDQDAAFLEQGYVMMTSTGCPWCVCARMGSFNSPFGWEGTDTPDRYQITSSLLFTYTTPSNLTGADVGIMRAWDDVSLSIRAFGVNGWDVQRDNNHGKSWGGRVDLAGDGVAFALAGLWGPEKDDNTREGRTLLNANLTLKPCWWLVAGLDAVYSAEEGEEALQTSPAFDGLSSWHAAQATLHAIFVKEISGALMNPEIAGGTLRFSMLRDQDAAVLGRRRTLYEFTAALSSQLVPNLFGRVEARFDSSMPNGDYTNYSGARRDNALRFGVEAYYLF